MNTYKYISVVIRDELFAFRQFCQESLFLLLAIFTLVIGIVTANLLVDDRIYFSSDGRDSVWHLYAMGAKDALEKSGLEVSILSSKGAIDNVEKLNDPNDKANVAFTYGAALTKEQASGVYSLGSIDYEPVWIFYKKNINKNIRTLKDLSSYRVGVGPIKSGTFMIAKKLFEANGVDITAHDNFRNDDFDIGAEKFIKGDLDVFIRITSNEDVNILKLLKDPSVELYNFKEALAYEKNFDYLKAVTLPAFSLDLLNQIPPKDIDLIATTTSLVVRRDLNPDLQLVLLMVAKDVITTSKRLFFVKRDEFPAYVDPLIPLSPIARDYYNYGPPQISRHLTYRMAAMIDRWWPFVLAFFAILYPLSRLSVNFRSLRYSTDESPIYEELLKIEKLISKGHLSVDEKQDLLARLNALSLSVSDANVPSGEEANHFALLNAIHLLTDRVIQ